MKCTSGWGAGSRRWIGIVKKIPYDFMPSPLSTWTTFLVVSGSASLKMYLPGARATPGSSTGAENVNNTRWSIVSADAFAALKEPTRAIATAHNRMLFLDMLFLSFRDAAPDVNARFG
jgi:hypothetical protein